MDQFSRTELLLGKDAMQRLKSSRVAVFGLGGVGSYTVEALARSGIGGFMICDDDRVCLTNINRQLIANTKTVGKQKTEVMREHILCVNPKAVIKVYDCFYSKNNADEFNLAEYDYIVDAIDTVSAKIELICRAQAAGVPVISCMGAGNKLDPTKFEVADIYATSIDPLAKVMRHELRARGVSSLKVVYSREAPMKPLEQEDTSCKTNCICPPDTNRNCSVRRQVPGSVAFVPPTAGLILAAEVVKDLIALSGH